MNRRAQGSLGEDAACAYLERRGWKIAGRNVRRKGGEIDIIAQRGDTCAFVEVKQRSSRRYGTPAEAVDAKKRRRIITVAWQYAAEEGLMDSRLRFDIIEVSPSGIRHIEGAFDASDSL